MTERVRSFTPIDVVPLPRPLCRFGNAFPEPLADAYTSAYTPRRGVVLDPLAHPWSAADAAERCDRRGLARSPQALGAWAREVVRAAPASEDILAALAVVADSTLGGPAHAIAMRELYASRCATCRGPIVVEAYLWERDAPVPTKKAFRCGICARDGHALLIEPIGADDEERTLRLEERGLAYWQMAERFSEGQELGESVASLYTPRNLAALMATVRAVETALPGAIALDVMRLCLLEVIVAGSKLNAVAGQGAPLRIEKGRARRGHASQFREVNVWVEYERTVRELAAWLAGHRPPVGARAPFGALDPGAADLVVAQVPVEDQLGGWSHVASALLGLPGGRPPDTADGKVSGRERMLRTTRQALLDAHRHTREGAIAVVYVPQADLGAIAAVALAGAGAGWQVASALYQPDALGGPAGPAAILELDRDSALLREQPAADAAAIERTIRTAVRDTIAARGGPIEVERAGAAAVEALASSGLLAPLALARAGGVSELEVFIDHFRSALADAEREGIRRVGDTVQRYDTARMADRAPLDDRVEWSVWGLLSSARDMDTRSVLRRTYALFRGPETPDRELVERCLASYGAQGEDGRWRLHDRDALTARQNEQTTLAAHLLDAGHRAGFKVHIGRDLQRRTLTDAFAGRGELLADLMSADEREAQLGRHVRGAGDALPYVDVVWYDRGRMVFLWQLDWTARLYRSVVDIGEAIADDERIFRFLAVPEERKALCVLKLTRAPALADVVRKRGWRFVKWAPLRAFAADPATGLAELEPVLGLEPAVERSAHQLSFKW
ncbi:MAG: hypothetical protein KGK34_02555 [Chloroflexota bacterium]|nr:hypothetical protein [Chloroflexota bacterium]